MDVDMLFATHLDWCKAALVEWDVSCDHAAQAVDDGTVRDGRGSVEVAIHLRTCAGEVKGGRAIPPAAATAGSNSGQQRRAAAAAVAAVAAAGISGCQRGGSSRQQ